MPFGFSSSAKHPNMSTNGTENGQKLPSNLGVTLLQSGTEKGHGDPSPGNGDRGPAPASEDWPPSGVDPDILKNFIAVDADNSKHITAIELQTALKNGGSWPPFEIDTVKLIMSIFDTNRNGSIDINEFVGLWKYIKSWEGVFHHFDQNNNNAIDGNELEQALERFGYHLSHQLQELLKRKYDVPWPTREEVEGRAGYIAPRGITFDRFMRACVVVKQLKESFEGFDKDPLGRVKINYEQFLELVFKLP
jgi:Ca2+-binding EF-hand superfamily protein